MIVSEHLKEQNGKIIKLAKKKFDSANICLILLWNTLTTKEYWMKTVGMLMKNGKKVLMNGVMIDYKSLYYNSIN